MKVALLYKKVDWLHHCGGTLVGDKYVITAAHCTEWVSAAHYIEWVRPEDLKVQIGETVLYNFNEAHSAPFRVASIIRHPNFTYIDNIPRYDIAVLKLTKRVPLYKYPNIKPACLPNQGALFHGDAIVTGWGRLNFHGHFATSLREVGVTVFDDKKCRIGTEDTICAGHRGGGRDACGGDSGGPLVAVDRDHHNAMTLIGVVSWGSGCGEEDPPGLYAEVSHVKNWLMIEMTDFNSCGPYSGGWNE